MRGGEELRVVASWPLAGGAQRREKWCRWDDTVVGGGGGVVQLAGTKAQHEGDKVVPYSAVPIDEEGGGERWSAKKPTSLCAREGEGGAS